MSNGFSTIGGGFNDGEGTYWRVNKCWSSSASWIEIVECEYDPNDKNNWTKVGTVSMTLDIAREIADAITEHLDWEDECKMLSQLAQLELFTE